MRWNLLVLVRCHNILLASLVHLLTVVSRQLFRINHRKHFGEALSDSRDSLRRVPEGKFAPRHVLHLLTVQIDDVLGARCAGRATEWLLREHGIVLVVITLLTHEQIVHVLQILL